MTPPPSSIAAGQAELYAISCQHCGALTARWCLELRRNQCGTCGTVLDAANGKAQGDALGRTIR